MNETSDTSEAIAGEPSQVQSQAPPVEDIDKTDNILAQRSVSLTSDDALLEERAVMRDSVASDDQEVLLELNTEDQEQFEVLDSADGEDDKSHDSISKISSIYRLSNTGFFWRASVLLCFDHCYRHWLY